MRWTCGGHHRQWPLYTSQPVGVVGGLWPHHGEGPLHYLGRVKTGSAGLNFFSGCANSPPQLNFYPSPRARAGTRPGFPHSMSAPSTPLHLHTRSLFDSALAVVPSSTLRAREQKIDMNRAAASHAQQLPPRRNNDGGWDCLRRRSASRTGWGGPTDSAASTACGRLGYAPRNHMSHRPAVRRAVRGACRSSTSPSSTNTAAVRSSPGRAGRCSAKARCAVTVLTRWTRIALAASAVRHIRTRTPWLPVICWRRNSAVVGKKTRGRTAVLSRTAQPGNKHQSEHLRMHHGLQHSTVRRLATPTRHFWVALERAGRCGHSARPRAAATRRRLALVAWLPAPWSWARAARPHRLLARAAARTCRYNLAVSWPLPVPRDGRAGVGEEPPLRCTSSAPAWCRQLVFHGSTRAPCCSTSSFVKVLILLGTVSSRSGCCHPPRQHKRHDGSCRT